MTKAVAEMANNCDLGVHEDDPGELLKEVPEQVTNGGLPEWEEEGTAEARKGKCRRTRTPKKLQ